MLGDVHRGTTIFAAERKPLEQSQYDQGDRGRDADPRVTRQESDRRRRAAHNQERRQKSELPPGEIADPAEHQRAEGTNREADGKRRQCFEKARRRIAAGEKLRRDDGGEAAEDIEVVPLDHRSHR